MDHGPWVRVRQRKCRQERERELSEARRFPSLAVALPPGPWQTRGARPRSCANCTLWQAPGS
eukprot:12241155-Alexandrium_andersonii.AAC.1